MPNPSPGNNPQPGPPSADGASRRHRPSRRMPVPTARARPPDLAEAAGRAVVSFLHDAAAATAERESIRAAGVGQASPPAPAPTGDREAGSEDRALPADDPIQWSAPAPARPGASDSVAVRAAAASVATLERIEAAAAKVEADIAAAHAAHAELQAGAGAAAEAAVRAAEEAWASASSAAESDVRAKISLRHVARWVIVTIVLVIIAAGILVASATTAR
jgi:hypothetical protein